MNRADALRQIDAGEPWDVLIIGGGATGLGAAVDAAARGYRTLLLEQADFAQATSSRSTKLVHGGVRYLAQGNIRLVRDALRERARLLRNAPGLAHVLPLVVPLQDVWQRFYLSLGLNAYDLLAGRRGLGHTKQLSLAQLRERVPGFAGPAPRGALLFFDGQFDDARLAIALARTIWEKGGLALNYARVCELRKTGDRISGAVFEDGETGIRREVRTRVVINATGVFADAVRRLDEPGASDSIAPSQGIHLVLPKRFLGGDTAILIPRTADGRVLFAIPWHDRVLLGTTDTPAEQPELEPRARAEEIEFLLDHARRFLGWAIAPADVLAVFAGLRPLVKASHDKETSAISRDHVINVSPSGLVSITGGKWTTYRLMAEDVVNVAAKSAELAARPCTTADLPLITEALPPDPLSAAAIRQAVQNEMARTVEDYLSRRTRTLILDARAAVAAAPAVAATMAAELGRDEAWQVSQVQQFQSLAASYILQT